MNRSRKPVEDSTVVIANAVHCSMNFRPVNHSLVAEVPMVTEAQNIEAGILVRIRSVASCVQGLRPVDQVRLAQRVGRLRSVAKFDAHGFVWVSFDDDGQRDDFCLLETEVEVV